MFNPINGGSLIEIPDNAFGFIYKCHLPPEGYGINVSNGKLEKTDIICRSDIEEEQYWERPILPHDYISKRKEEKKIQRFDKFYVDPYLEEIRKREWGRRLRGVWFYNYNPYKKKTELVYLVGVYYFMLTYWRFQGKFFDFRIPDLHYWYVIRYDEEDANCLGMNDIEKRKGGKTARLGCWLYERASRMNNHHAGLQSKSDDDAWEVFKKGVVHPFKTLPDFFRPRFDTMKGDDPNDELRFFASSRRGEKALEDDDEFEEPLNSFIDYKPSTESSYDGPELDSYGSDEAGKTKKPVSILERQRVVRFCAEIDGEFLHRKQIYTTTVEPEKNEEENEEFQELTAASNPLERDANGRTGTGLYSYFLPAQKGMFFDKYGYPDEQRAMRFLNNTIESLLEKGDTRGLSSFKRKNPQNFKQAFSADGENSLFDPEIINNQLDHVLWTSHLTEFGDLEWKNGCKIKIEDFTPSGEVFYNPSELIWKPNPKGDFEKVKGWMPREPNNVFLMHDSFMPNNGAYMRIGCDPFKYDKTKEKRRSDCAAFAFQMEDTLFPSEYDNMPVIRYCLRKNSTTLANEDILKMAWWCGSPVLFERNINHWKADFKTWKCAGFLMWMPNDVEPGIYTDGNAIQSYCNYIEQYINLNIKNIYFKSLLKKETGLLGLKVEDTEKFHEPMAFGITLTATKLKANMWTNPTMSLEDFFPKRKIEHRVSSVDKRTIGYN